MGYATIPKIQRTMTTTTTNYDILKDDAILLAQLKAINPDFPTTSIPIDISVFLETGTACQIKVNNGEWQDFVSEVSYSLEKITNIKSIILSATACKYTISISFE